MTAQTPLNLHEDYFATVPKHVRPILERIQALVEEAVPDCTRCISYRMPAFRRGKVFFFFAAFQHHIGIYPPLRKHEALIERLTKYRGKNGNLSFPLREEIPYALIVEVACALAQEIAPASLSAKRLS